MSIFKESIEDVINNIYQSIYILQNVDKINVVELKNEIKEGSDSRDINNSVVKQLTSEENVKKEFVEPVGENANKVNELVKPVNNVLAKPNNDLVKPKEQDENDEEEFIGMESIHEEKKAVDVKMNGGNEFINFELL